MVEWADLYNINNDHVTGFRFFRCDFIIEEQDSMIQCTRCEVYIYPDESYNDNMLQDGLCLKCLGLLRGRLQLLKHKDGYCPKDPVDFILTKKYHSKMGRGRDY